MLDGNRVVGTGELAANGRVTIEVAGLERGIHLLTVRFEGTSQLEGDRSFPRIVLVW